MLTHARLLELVHYDPKTGVFTARVARKQVKAGQRLGTLNAKGYLHCRVERTRYLLHRLAWFYMKKRWPVGFLDHRNRKRADNRWRNLREATNGQNRANTDVRVDNAAGLKGVHLRRLAGGRIQYEAQITARGMHFYLGAFDTAEEAHAAYVSAAEVAHGEFFYHGR